MNIMLIRHGLTKSNVDKKYLGRMDEKLILSEKKRLKDKWSDIYNPDLIFVSPMKRCLESADIIFSENAKNKIVIDELKEIDFGIFEGKSYEMLKDDKEYKKWLDSGGTSVIPKGESREYFIKRTIKGFNKALKIAKEKNAKDIVLVVHGGTIMAILSEISKRNYYDFQIKNGEGIKLILEEDKYEIPYYSICGRIDS